MRPATLYYYYFTPATGGPSSTEVTGSGGITFDGTANIAVGLVIAAAGGITFGGAVEIVRGFLVVGEGGGVFGGSAIVTTSGDVLEASVLRIWHSPVRSPLRDPVRLIYEDY